MKQDENLKELKTELSTTSDNRNNDTSREFENPPKEVANLGNKKAFEKKCNQCGKIFYRIPTLRSIWKKSMKLRKLLHVIHVARSSY